jgi:hypothetical protein
MKNSSSRFPDYCSQEKEQLERFLREQFESRVEAETMSRLRKLNAGGETIDSNSEVGGGGNDANYSHNSNNPNQRSYCRCCVRYVGTKRLSMEHHAKDRWLTHLDDADIVYNQIDATLLVFISQTHRCWWGGVHFARRIISHSGEGTREIRGELQQHTAQPQGELHEQALNSFAYLLT